MAIETASEAHGSAPNGHEGNGITPFMTPQEFSILLKHAEVVMGYSDATPDGNLERLEDSPIEEGGPPMKRYRISIDGKGTHEQSSLAVLRNLARIRRDLTTPYDTTLGAIDREMIHAEAGIQDFYRDHSDLLATVPVVIATGE
jgi:hypothetical protein